MSYLGAASTNQTKAGPSYRADSEVILKSNEKYLVRVENISGGNLNIMVNVEWYELD